jgi:hypothetical protein
LDGIYLNGFLLISIKRRLCMRRFVFIAIAVFLLCVPATFSISHAEDMKTGNIAGQLMIKGGAPMSGGLVYLFSVDKPLPSYDKYWRIPDFVINMDEKGSFNADVLTGTYCLGAIKRAGIKTQIGPPAEGDYFFISQDEKGSPRKYTVNKGEKLDIGVIEEASPYKKSDIKEGITAIEGYIFDEDGKPVEGSLVFASLTPTIVGKPLFVSERTAKDGKYLLRVHEGGVFYLITRNVYGGGPPMEGEVLSTHSEKSSETDLIKITVNTGEIKKGVDMKGKKFSGRGPNAPEVQTGGKKGAETGR